MKILYIITQGENGGAQKNVLDLASFSSQDNDVFVAVGEIKDEKDTWLHSQLLNKGVPKTNLHSFQNLVRNISPLKEFKAFLEIYKFVRNNNFELIHLHSSKAGALGSLASKLAGAKVVYTVHGFVFQEPMNVLKKLFYIFSELIASFFIDYHICVSQKDEDLGKRYFILRGRNNYGVIYNGVNSSQNNLLTKNEAQKYLEGKLSSSLNGVTVFGNIANLYPAKGLSYFIEACKLLKAKTEQKFICLIFGDGELRQDLQAEIFKSGVENEFRLLGYTQNASQYLKGLDVLVMSSVKEGLPYALVEASRAELPIISTNVGGIPEMSKYFKINLVEAKNAELLAEAMYRMLDVDTREENKSEFNENFSLKEMTEKTLSVYKKLTE